MCPVPLGISIVSPFPIKKCSSFSPLFRILLKAHQFLSFTSPMSCYLCPAWSHPWGRLDVLGIGRSVEKDLLFGLV